MTAYVFLLLSVAQATDLHTGVPVVGIDGLSLPRFQTVDTGWAATVPSGFVRIYVGATQTDAMRWISDRKEKLVSVNPKPNTEYVESSQVDEAYGDGTQLLMFRSKNVAVCSRNKIDATVWADTILHSIVDIPYPWPQPPSLAIEDDFWVIKAAHKTHHLSFVGGKNAESAELRFTQPPYRVIAWDAWGRAAWTEVAVP